MAAVESLSGQIPKLDAAYQPDRQVRSDEHLTRRTRRARRTRGLGVRIPFVMKSFKSGNDGGGTEVVLGILVNHTLPNARQPLIRLQENPPELTLGYLTA